VSVEAKSNGNLRLRCACCECKFVPRMAFQDAAQLRLRAGLYGWGFVDGRDYCPADRPETAYQGGETQ
jgi:hypothetical protein